MGWEDWVLLGIAVVATGFALAGINPAIALRRERRAETRGAASQLPR